MCKLVAGLSTKMCKLFSGRVIALTLLDNIILNIILNITVSYMTDGEKEKFQKMFTENFGGEEKIKSYLKVIGKI